MRPSAIPEDVRAPRRRARRRDGPQIRRVRAAAPVAALLLLAPAAGATNHFPQDAWGIRLFVQAFDDAGAFDFDEVLGTSCSVSGHLCSVSDGMVQAAVSDASSQADVSLDPGGFWRQRFTITSNGAPLGGGQFADAEVDVLEKIRIDPGSSGLPPDATVPIVIHLKGTSTIDDPDQSAVQRAVEAFATLARLGQPDFFFRNYLLESQIGQEEWSIAFQTSPAPVNELLRLRLVLLGRVEQDQVGAANLVEADVAWRVCATIPGVDVVLLSPAHDDGDLDGDVLPDCWEVAGRDVDADGAVDLDLAAMGADPEHKDLFVEIDAMVDVTSASPHSHVPKPQALARAIATFEDAPVANPDGETGIRLHVDAGPASVMNPSTGATWGMRSRANVLAHQDLLGLTGNGEYLWSDFDRIKSRHFADARASAFRYAVFAHDLGGKIGVSGIARGFGVDDFIVSLGDWTNQVGTVGEQAGTFLHELGHALGLLHGGGDHVNRKPNYLSVMNYSFQTKGLWIGGGGGHYDYSRAALAPLDENALDEMAGVADAPLGYGTRAYCGSFDWDGAIHDPAAGPIDWNCDGTPSSVPVFANVNRTCTPQSVSKPEDCMPAPPLFTVLTGHDDWASLRFAGDAVGATGASSPSAPPATTPVDELTESEDAQLATPLAVAVDSEGVVALSPSGTTTLTFHVRNTGENPDTYDLVGASALGWADLAGIPAAVSLASGAQTPVAVPVAVPASPPAGATEKVTLLARSQANPRLEDAATTLVLPDADSDGDLVTDGLDNCVVRFNPGQGDADGDNVGDPCDCDFDNDGSCNIADFNLFLADFAAGTDAGAGTDMDGDGRVGIGDFNLFLPGFAAGAPGPSGPAP